MESTYDIERPEYHVHPSRDRDAAVVSGAQDGEAGVDPEEGEERHGLFKQIAYNTIPSEHRLVRHVVVPLKLARHATEH